MFAGGVLIPELNKLLFYQIDGEIILTKETLIIKEVEVCKIFH